MSQFIGLHMRVVLRDPAGHLLTGTVSDVQAGISLTLTNGKRVCSFVFSRFSILILTLQEVEIRVSTRLSH